MIGLEALGGKYLSMTGVKQFTGLTEDFIYGSITLAEETVEMIGLVLFGYIVVPQWWMMVALGVFAGIGAGAIDAGLNTYVAAHFGERLMQWLHACYGIGVTIGPIIMTITLTATGKWRAGYIVVGIFQFILAACFAFTLKMWERKGKLQEESETKKLTDYRTPIFATLRLPRVWLSLGRMDDRRIWRRTSWLCSKGSCNERNCENASASARGAALVGALAFAT